MWHRPLAEYPYRDFKDVTSPFSGVLVRFNRRLGSNSSVLVFFFSCTEKRAWKRRTVLSVIRSSKIWRARKVFARGMTSLNCSL